MSRESKSQLEQLVESAQKYARESPYTVATVMTGSAAVLAGSVAYWRLKATPHPNTISLDLPMHPFLGHIPAVKELVASKQWIDWQTQMLNSEQVKKEGLVTMCFPHLLVPYIHFIVDPDLIKLLFSDLNIPKGESYPECFAEVFGDTVIASDGDDWQIKRRTATPMFSQHNLQGFMFDCSRDAAQRVVDMLKSRMIEDESGKKSITVDMFDVLGRFTMDVIVEVCFGQHYGSIEDYPEELPFDSAFDRAFSRCSVRIRDPLWKLKRYFRIGEENEMAKDVQIMNEAVDEMLGMEDRKKRIFDESGVIQHDILSLYLVTQPDLSEHELRDIALLFIFAGRDTTRNLLAWCLALMCTSEKEWMERVMAEIRGIDSKDPSYEDINKRLRLTECVLLETLRLYPSVAISIRQLNRDITLPNGIKLFKGEALQIKHFAQARNTKVYGEDAAEFNPMRWWDKGINTFPSHVFGAFHIEPRVCLGRKFGLTEAKTFLFYFLRAFDHRSVGDVFPEIPTTPILMMEDGWDTVVSVK